MIFCNLCTVKYRSSPSSSCKTWRRVRGCWASIPGSSTRSAHTSCGDARRDPGTPEAPRLLQGRLRRLQDNNRVSSAISGALRHQHRNPGRATGWRATNARSCTRGEEVCRHRCFSHQSHCLGRATGWRATNARSGTRGEEVCSQSCFSHQSHRCLGRATGWRATNARSGTSREEVCRHRCFSHQSHCLGRATVWRATNARRCVQFLGGPDGPPKVIHLPR